VKTRGINMLQPLKCVGKKYKTLIVKMAINYSSLELAKANLLNLCDINTILVCHVFCPCWKLLMPWWVYVAKCLFMTTLLLSKSSTQICTKGMEIQTPPSKLQIF